MSLVSSELYATLLAAGIDMATARMMAQRVASHERRLATLEQEIREVVWTLRLLIVMLLVLAGGLALYY